MIARLSSCFLLLSLVVVGSGYGADETPQPTARELLRARMAEDAKKAPGAKAAAVPAAPSGSSSAEPAAASTATTQESNTATDPVTTKTPAKAKSKTGNSRAKDAIASKEAPTVLPKMEVKKSRITELDQQLAKQDLEIARERKNLKSSEVDNALNDSKVARPLSIFGGDSTQFRKGVASERVQLMEAEKDLMEAIAHAKTKEEKAALQTQLNELKAMRRELDRTMR